MGLHCELQVLRKTKAWICTLDLAQAQPLVQHPPHQQHSAPCQTREQEVTGSTPAVYLMVWHRSNSSVDHRFHFYLLRACHSLKCIQAQNTSSSSHPSSDVGNLNWDDRKHLKTLINILSEAMITYYLTLLVWFCLVFKNKQTTLQNPALLKMLLTHHNFKTYHFEVFWHLRVNMEAPTSPDNSEPACHFSSLLLSFIESVLLNCSVSLLSRIAVQIKTSLQYHQFKNKLLLNNCSLFAIWIVISLGFTLATLLINSKDTALRKAIPPSPVQHDPLLSYSSVPIHWKIIYTHNILQICYLHGALLSTSICLYSSPPRERHKSYSSWKQGGKNSRSFSAKAKQFIRKDTPVTNFAILRDLNGSQRANLGILNPH